MNIISTFLVNIFLIFPIILAFYDDVVYVSITEAPFVLAVVQDTPDGPHLDCMAILVHRRWALTSSKCFAKPDNKFIAYGISDIKQFSKNQTLPIEEIIYHPGYHEHININDIAIVKFKTPVEFDETVKSIELEGTTWPQDNRAMKRACINYRFGQTRRLIAAHVTARHGKLACFCYSYIRNICSFPGLGDNTCDGDFGGPLICDGKLVGIANTIVHLESCLGLDTLPSCGDPLVWSMYTFTCPYLQWVKWYVKKTPAPPASCDALRNAETVRLTVIFLSIWLHYIVRNNLH
ncbi:kallikrein-7-like [Rhodnius prolixus]|uniref:kallikrein-7-like n=1 Tax=Rhodnius prolixus TaxID=13249 RepID=UPI003D189226